MTENKVELHTVPAGQLVANNPTIGILLCTETDNVIAKYSVLNGSK